MNAATHTPGPWTLAPNGRHVWADFPHDGWSSGRVVAIVDAGSGSGRDAEVVKVNAALIAAAPDMLDALRTLVAYAEIKWREQQAQQFGTEFYRATNSAIEAARDAIAKAAA